MSTTNPRKGGKKTETPKKATPAKASIPYRPKGTGGPGDSKGGKGPGDGKGGKGDGGGGGGGPPEPSPGPSPEPYPPPSTAAKAPKEKPKKVPTPSIYDALWECQPKFKGLSTGGAAETVSSSGASTTATPCPKYLKQRSAEMFFNTAQSKKAILKRSAKCQEPRPQNTQSNIVNSEADLSKVSTVYLVHPLEVALQALVTRGKIICTAEHVQDGDRSSRTDFTFAWQESKDSRPETIAILELKKPHALQEEQFKRADVRTGTKADFIRLRDLGQKSKTGDGSVDKTALQGNARLIMKQARKYADSQHTNFIAVYDGTALVLLHIPFRAVFEGAPKAAPDFPLPDNTITHWAWYEEFRGDQFVEVPSTTGGRAKKVFDPKGMSYLSILLGFFITALQSFDQTKAANQAGWAPVMKSADAGGPPGDPTPPPPPPGTTSGPSQTPGKAPPKSTAAQTPKKSAAQSASSGLPGGTPGKSAGKQPASQNPVPVPATEVPKPKTRAPAQFARQTKVVKIQGRKK